MAANKGKGPVFDPGLCRCCGNMKKCRVLNIEYESLGKKEVYSDMIMDSFGLLLSHLDGLTSERLICAVCVSRVREALIFRKQVLKCEEAFLQMKIYDTKLDNKSGDPNLIDALMEFPDKPILEVELVKTEPLDEMDMDDRSDVGDVLDLKEDKKLLMEENTNSSDDIKHPLLIKKPKEMKVKGTKAGKNRGAASLARQIMRTRQSFAEKLKQKSSWSVSRIQRPMIAATAAFGSPVKNDQDMTELQQKMREKDPSYKRETNIMSIIEYSYVCPFKCRHNHLLCHYCGDSFLDPQLLREHTIKIHNPKKLTINEHRAMIKIDLTRIDCRLCTVKIDNLDDFRSHITSVHGKKYFFDSKDSLLPFKLSSGELKCALCDMSYPYFHALNKHMNVHFSNYVCETCGLGFVDHARFMMHQQRHDQGEFPCATCGKVFKAQYNRDLHVDRVHRKKGRVYCPKCDVKLMSYPQKLKHLVEVHGEEPLSFPCDMCDRVFDSRRILTIHKRKDHLKDYRYECQCCRQKFFTRFALDNHMPTHTGERNFKCKVCEKSYPRLKTLKDHMRIHTNDRRYSCHVCGQAFIQNCSLKGHMKSQHPEYG